jgi:hypothetical protein
LNIFILTPSKVLSAPLNVSDPNLDLINEVYDRFGPIPRLCFKKLSTRDALESYERQLGNALVELTANQLRDLIYEAATLAQDNLSYKICLIRCVDQDKISDNVYITPITDSIASKLPIRFRDLECHEQVGLYKDCAGMLSTRGMTGHLFAGYCQQRFQTKICLRFVANPSG